MEIADIFIMNKSDREGAGRALSELQTILHLRPNAAWNPPVLATIASQGQGIEAVWGKISAHRTFNEQNGRLQAKRRDRLEQTVRELVTRQIREEFWDKAAQDILRHSLAHVHNHQFTPYQIAEELMTRYHEMIRHRS